MRLYTYRPHVALVGRFQNIEAELNLDECDRFGAEINRRPTGGGAIVMGDGQLGLALVLPPDADLGGATPAAFKAALERARVRLERNKGPQFLTLNSWNEWTEGSYLEPDTLNGMACLQAIRDIFPSRT